VHAEAYRNRDYLGVGSSAFLDLVLGGGRVTAARARAIRQRAGALLVRAPGAGTDADLRLFR